MSIGFPDGQRITQWLGAVMVQAAALAIGNVLHEDGPFNLASWASVIVAVKPTGGNVVVTIRQRVSGGPAALELDETFLVTAGNTLFESVVLFGDIVYLDLTGSAPGVTVDYALYPSNTTTNAQVLATATVNVQHNDALVAAEPALDFEDAGGARFAITDDPTNSRMKVSASLDVSARGVSVQQNIPSGVLTAVDWGAGSGQVDTAGMVAAAAATTDLKVVTAGLYLVWASMWFPAASPGGYKVIQLKKNGGNDFGAGVGGAHLFNPPRHAAPPGDGNEGAGVDLPPIPVQLAAGDVLTVWIAQDAGVAVATSVGVFAAMRIG